MFLVWGPPIRGPRSRALARALGISRLHFVHTERLRGGRLAPLRYVWQLVVTMRLLFRDRPAVVFVQSPPNLAVLCAFLYHRFTGSQYVVDAHSAALLSPWWTRPRWFNSLLVRHAITAIATNERLAETLRGWQSRVLILKDIPLDFAVPAPPSPSARPDGFVVTVVNTFSDDEPLNEILAAARSAQGVTFNVTGRTRSANPLVLASAPKNVHFTDYLPDASYYALLASSDAVMCLTTRDHTMQRGACEALALGRPIITSNWPVLRSYFSKGAIHVQNSAHGILFGLLAMQEDYARYCHEILELRSYVRQETWDGVDSLFLLVERSLGKDMNRC